MWLEYNIRQFVTIGFYELSHVTCKGGAVAGSEGGLRDYISGVFKLGAAGIQEKLLLQRLVRTEHTALVFGAGFFPIKRHAL
jgi:hypothetical protein